MAPLVANFHHIEIDNIGKRRRNLHPPGGQSSDIFNFREKNVVTQPRKVKFHNRSSIFSREYAPGISKLPLVSIEPRFNTKQRLFGPPDEIPRRAVDRMKSSIFATDPEPKPKPKPKALPAKPDRRNPITGEECAIIKYMKRHQIEKKKSNPITGEGYEPPDEDCSTVISSSSSRSSRSDIRYKEIVTTRPSSSSSHTYSKDETSAQTSSPRSHTCSKDESFAQRSSLDSHALGKEETCAQSNNPDSRANGREGVSDRTSHADGKDEVSDQPGNPGSHAHGKEGVSDRSNSASSHTYGKEEISDEPSKEVVIYNTP